MMRVICRFKILAIIVLTFFVMSSKGQIYQVMPQYGYKFNRIAVDSTLHIPSYCGVPSITDYIKNGMIAIDTCNNVLFQWTRANGWTPISTGTYLDTTSLSNRINQRVKYTDTSAMLLPYLKKIDTTAMLSRYLRKSDTASLSNRINLKLNISDTSTMLSKYLRIFDTTSMLSKYLRRSDTTTMLSPYVRKVTTISTTAPLTGGGNLTTNRTISIPQATGIVDGYMAATDFDRFAYTLSRVKVVSPLNRALYPNPVIGTDSVVLFMTESGATQDGYLSKDFWNLFYNKVDTIYKIGDSLVYSIQGGSKTLKIGIGGGGSTDTTNKFVNNVIKLNDSTISVYKGTGFTNITLSPSTTVAAATRLVTTVYNNSGATIEKGSVVYINGRHSSNYPTIAKAQANTEDNSYSTFAMVQDDILNNNTGTVIQAGNISNLNLPTATYTDGQVVYLSPTVAGGITTTKPLAPYHIVKIGTVTRAHPTQGSIELKIENGWQLDELSDVQIALVPLDSTILQFSRVDSLWHDVNPTTAMGNRFVKNISRVSGKDSIIFTIGSTRYAIKDSSGGAPAGSNGYVQFNNSSSFGADSSLFFDNTNKRLGVGTTSPSTKLDVVSGTKSTMPYNYEMATFSRNGEAKLGVYNTDSYANGTGASITLGNSKNVNGNGTYPGFEFQNVNDSGNYVESYSRYNYLERNTSGTVVGANVDLFKIYADGRVVMTPTTFGLSASPKLIIGDGSSTGDYKIETYGDVIFHNNVYASDGSLYTGKVNRYVTAMHSTTTTTYTVGTTDHVLLMYPDDANMTVILPQADAPEQEGRELIIKQVGNIGTYTVTVDGDGFNIDGNGSVVLAASGAATSLTIICADSEWHIINGNIE